MPIRSQLLMLAIVGCTPTPEQVAEREAARAAQRRGLDAYMAQLERVHSRLRAIDLDELAPARCAGIDLRARAHWPDEQGPLHMRIVHLDFLRRFGEDDVAWTATDRTWDWITDSTLAGHFDRPLAVRDERSIADTAERVAEMFSRDPYLIVVRGFAEQDIMPALDPADTRFDSGYWAGWMFVVERATATVVCQAELVVTSSDEVWDFGIVEPTDEEMIRADFIENFFTAVDRGLADATL